MKWFLLFSTSKTVTVLLFGYFGRVITHISIQRKDVMNQKVCELPQNLAQEENTYSSSS